MMDHLLELLVTSSVLISGVTALRCLLRGRISPRLQYALWVLVLVRLLIPLPVTVQSPVSVMYPAREAVHYVQAHTAQAASPAPSQDTGAAAGVQSGAPAAAGGDAPVRAEERGPRVSAVLPVVWAVGAIAVGAWFLLANLRFSAMLRFRRVSLDGRFTGLPLPVYAVAGLPSPCLFGLLRPAVYLPEHCLGDARALRHILAHELTHWRQKDVLWSALRGVCLTLYWFDPFVWLAAVLSRRDCELSCDAGAIRRVGEAERIAYGRTLLSLMAQRTTPAALLCAATTMSGGARSRRERIMLIARRPQAKAATVALTVLLAAVCAACTFTGAPDDGSGDGGDFPGKVLYEVNGLTVPVPEGALDGLVVRTGEEADLDGRGVGLISLYDKTAWEETLTEYGEEGGGWVISLTVMSEASYEQYLMYDSSGLYCFARDDEGNYFFRCTPTDVRIMDDARRAAAQDIADEMMNDFFQANRDRLSSISPSDFYAREYTFDSAEHRYVTFAPYGAARPERWGIVLSHPLPVLGGDGGGAIWCVDRWVDNNGWAQPYFPDAGMPSREYYAGLQRAYDEDPAEYGYLTDPRQIARRFLTEFLSLGADVGEIVEVSDAPPEWFTESVRRSR